MGKRHSTVIVSSFAKFTVQIRPSPNVPSLFLPTTNQLRHLNSSAVRTSRRIWSQLDSERERTTRTSNGDLVLTSGLYFLNTHCDARFDRIDALCNIFISFSSLAWRVSSTVLDSCTWFKCILPVDVFDRWTCWDQYHSGTPIAFAYNCHWWIPCSFSSLFSLYQLRFDTLNDYGAQPKRSSSSS